MRPCIYYQMIVTMSRRINFVIGVFSFILFYATPMLAQSDKAVFHIQVFKNDSTILREGTGFFIYGKNMTAYILSAIVAVCVFLLIKLWRKNKQPDVA